MATYDLYNQNQGDISRHGNWIWNLATLVGKADNDEHVLFKLPSNVIVLGGVLRIVTAGVHSAGTATIDAVNLRDFRANSTVQLLNICATALDLKTAPSGGSGADAAVALALTAATGIGRIPRTHATAGSGDDNVMTYVNAVQAIATGPMDGAQATILCGLHVARVDYDKA
jgi:hypothetical protein